MKSDRDTKQRLSRNIAVAIVAATAVAIFVVALMRVLTPGRQHIDVERSQYPVMGVDISAHNGSVDFVKVADAGIDFVFVKATEGETFRDPRFLENFRGARDAGLKVGAYHFFRFDCDGYLQGRNFLAVVDSLDLDLPLAIDIEEWGNPNGYSTGEVVAALRGMIIALEGSRRQVILYTNKNGYNRFIRGRFEEIPVWVCSFTDPPISNDNWMLWQHSHLSHIDGISGYVDLNTFNGDRDRWNSWVDSLGGKD